MTRLSGITPSGEMQLGNYLGAVRVWARESGPDDLYFVSDLHAMTTPHDPGRLRELTTHQLALLIAAGVPAESLFVQSDLIGEHMALTWLLECTCTYGEARRMIQFREKGDGRESVRLGLLTYPVLMAGDILLHGTHEVPVGEDQGQHVELARTLARRFNATYGEVFVVPTGVVPAAGARIKDLADPRRKMSKSGDGAGTVFVLDPPDVVVRKIRRAVTDTLGVVRHAPRDQPGVSNLLEIIGACTGSTPSDISTYKQLKETAAEVVLETLRPVRERGLELLSDPAELGRIRAEGAERARKRSADRLATALRLAGVA